MHAFHFRLERRVGSGLAALCCLTLLGCAGPTPSDVAEGVHGSASKASAPFVSGIYRGTIGQEQVDMTLKLDADSVDSLHGWYSVTGDPQRAHVLLAGELEDEALSMEESINGVDVSGHFNAVVTAESFTGEWSDINGEKVRQIDFRRVANAVPAP